MTIGFLGEPARPMVDASGMPISMCVAWMEPVERLSRMAAQLAPFVTVELMPYFLKKPFSCAMTMGEQSVSAIMPKLRSVTSGASEVEAAVAAQLRLPSAAHRAAAPASWEPRERNWRRLSADGEFVAVSGLVGCMLVKVGGGGAVKVFAEQAREQARLGERARHQAGGHEFVLQGGGPGRGGGVGVAAAEDQKVRRGLHRPEAGGETSLQG